MLKEWASLPIFKHILTIENTGRKRTTRKRKLTQPQRNKKPPRLKKLQKVESSDSDDTVIYDLPDKTSDKNLIMQYHTDEADTTPKSPVKAEVPIIEDESDVFLKSVATNNIPTLSQVCVKAKDIILNNHSPEYHPEVDSELMERRLFKTEESTESDNFLKTICSQSPIKAEVINECESNIYKLGTSLEVDALVADVMKMVQH